MSADIEHLRQRVRDFAAQRDWEQFHTPKNLAMALGGEAGELLAEVQWLADAEITERLAEGELRQRLAEEAADVFIYLVRLADVAGFDLVEAALAKVEKNELRYPVAKSRGRADKYTTWTTADQLRAD